MHARVLGVAILINQIIPRKYSKQNVLYLTAVKQNNIVEPYSDHGIINIHGLLFAPAGIKFSAGCAAWPNNKSFYHLQYLKLHRL